MPVWLIQLAAGLIWNRCKRNAQDSIHLVLARETADEELTKESQADSEPQCGKDRECKDQSLPRMGWLYRRQSRRDHTAVCDLQTGLCFEILQSSEEVLILGAGNLCGLLQIVELSHHFRRQAAVCKADARLVTAVRGLRHESR